jgi:hypothetical protein
MRRGRPQRKQESPARSSALGAHYRGLLFSPNTGVTCNVGTCTGSAAASACETQFRSGQRADGLLLEAQGLRLADVAGASRLFGGLGGATNFDLVHGSLVWLMMSPDDPVAV